ncbi:exodeoxyribonuclease VII small subunit [Helicobacter sp. MIT 05-5293]|uniref:exodeoxyribonuclease VII small subunit n=1 Tax=Helicobacter sp. MIT 05-5293 TaxID=1548149 RepID=UPI00051DA81D|nr:exodeoxyribonuclease VII small subunit [Helicobacter sp. MIT 05-5293]TLD81011.1 exodeoxyribonuclease VII small subunit [Helicobacter sp. MIT 05-5293]
MADSHIHTDIEESDNKEENFEEMVEFAKKVLGKLSSQEITLKESLQLYEQGMESLKKAQSLLEDAKIKYQEFQESKED